MPRSSRRIGPTIAAIAAAALAPAIAAADPIALPPHIAHAVRLHGSIHVDGHLDEAAWQDAPAQGDFWQQSPSEGEAPKHRTEFRILYDDQAVYVAVRAYDDCGKVRALLHRRDLQSQSDWVGVMFDSYHDRRTAFAFGLNAAGVQRDVLMYDDTNEDQSWDAVWTSAAAIDHDGWTAEMRIPLGQLRFSAHDHNVWGVQVMRMVGRDGEQSLWSPSPRSARGFVSNFGELDGLDQLHARPRLELLPYVTGGLGHTADAGPDPFRDAIDPRGTAGLDVRLGLGPAVTVAATVNPDFGQVEADPSQVNLSANETFFPEKRPFFLEGTEIFQFPLGQGDGPGGQESLFYSRRIGAPPHEVQDGAYVDAPDNTTIYGAGKVSGKTDGGLAFGLLEAVTAQESSTADDGTGMRETQIVEPLTNYALARVKKDLRGGKTNLGAALTDVARRTGGTGLDRNTDLWDALRDHAVTGGLALDHKFGHDKWALMARLAGSWVHGSTDAILDTQLAYPHLFQRPDATHVEVDPTRTSLAGSAQAWSLGYQGQHFRFATGGDGRSPGFEANDLGFQNNADQYVQWFWMQHRQDEPGDVFLSWFLNWNAYLFGNFAPEFLGGGGNMNFHGQFRNFWFLHAGINVDRAIMDPTALRGGPSLRVDPVLSAWASTSSDGRKSVSFELNGRASRTPADGSWNAGVDGSLTAQIRSNIELSAGPSVSFGENGTQYVDAPVDDAGMTHYVFSRIRQRTLGLTVRGSWTFTPDLSLQVYAQPFVAAGAYGELKQASATRARRYDDRFAEYTPAEITRDADDVYEVDQNHDGATDYAFAVPDFNVRDFNSNVVLRWQYRPGSTVFFIWSHRRDDSVVQGDLDLGRDLGALARAGGEHLVMVKANYWYGL